MEAIRHGFAPTDVHHDGCPNVAETSAYYADFGLVADEDGWFTTRTGGRQLRIVAAPTRRLVDLHVGVDDMDDLARASRNLRRLGLNVQHGPGWIRATERATGTIAYLEIAPRPTEKAVPATPYNGPGRAVRTGGRAPGVLRTAPVRPRKLGHAVLGSTDFEATRSFFTEGLGFKISDHIKGAGTFMRCSTDHHNILVLQAPVSFLHHTSWEVDDVRRRSGGVPSRCSKTIPNDTSGASAVTTAVRTSSGT